MKRRPMRGKLALSLISLGASAAIIVPSALVSAAGASSSPASPASGPSSSAHPSQSSRHVEIRSLSNPRPQLVSGDQVLLSVTVPPSRHARHLKVTVDGRDVTAAFSPGAGGPLVGLVTGLKRGSNRIVAEAEGEPRAELTVVNHSIDGPVFSGPQQLPFICETPTFGLAPTVPPACSAPTTVTFRYRTTAGKFVDLADPALRPSDLASAVVNGRSVPYIVRLEQGTIDRAVYQMAVLFDGTSPSPVRPQASWNDKLIYTFGGGCNAGFHQGRGTGGVMEDQFLSKGYAVASSTLNVLQNNCSTVISAEAAMMVKEHFIDTYGPVQHTIGWGGSGGAIQQYDIADAYPGILDGIVPAISFADPVSSGGPVTDCRLLERYFAATATTYTPEQMRAISGYGDFATCHSWDLTFANTSTPTKSCDPSIPKELLFDPVTNPKGVICASIEQMVNQLGSDPKTGLPRSFLDSVGVQYGLQALLSGAITPAQFVDLNTAIGGFDTFGNSVAARTQADPIALKAVYQDSLLLNSGEGLAATPIIDQRTYLDASGFAGDIHTTQNSFIVRARLLHENGTAANQVIIESAPNALEQTAATEFALNAMDRWLTSLDADHSHRSARQKVIMDRPADLSDGCFLASGQRIAESLSIHGAGQCATRFPVFADPRLVAGQPLTENVMKCQLQPLDFSAYPVTFTAAQQAQLRTAFPHGVCDYGDRGVGQQEPLGQWLTYGDGPTSRRTPVPVPAP